jgi:hypothetical protein
MNHWNESDSFDGFPVDNPIDDIMEAQGFKHTTNFDKWRESCALEAASAVGLTVVIRDEAYDQSGNPVEGDRLKSLYIPFDSPQSITSAFWTKFDMLSKGKEREIRLYKSTKLVECPDFKGRDAKKFVGNLRWDCRTCTIERRVYEELSKNGSTQVPTDLLIDVLDVLTTGGCAPVLLPDKEG